MKLQLKSNDNAMNKYEVLGVVGEGKYFFIEPISYNIWKFDM